MGIDFFLSFFLTKAQMELFMKSRQYLNRGGYNKPPTQRGRNNSENYLYDRNGNLKKRLDGSLRSANDIIDLEKNRFIASFYAQRDASESAGYWLGKHSLFDMDVAQFHMLQMTNYLGALPNYLYHELSESKQLNIVQRIAKRPTSLLATSIALLADNEPNLEWRVFSDEVIQKKVSHANPIKEDLQKIPEAYYTTKAKYVNQLGITKVEANRLQQDTQEVATEKLQVQEALYMNADKIMIRIKTADKTYMHFIIGYQNIKHWGALLGMSKIAPSIEALKKFANDFMKWLMVLQKSTNQIAYAYKRKNKTHYQS